MKTFFLSVFIVAGVLRMEAQELYARTDYVGDRPAGAKDAVANKAYDWEFYSAVSDNFDHAYAKADEQIFGKRVACLLALLDERFVKKEQVSAGDPSLHTTIDKPVVYNAVKNISKYYKQKKRTDEFTGQDAEVFAHVVKVALACIGDDSAGFEKVLKKSKKDPEQQLACFCRVKLTNIYE